MLLHKIGSESDQQGRGPEVGGQPFHFVRNAGKTRLSTVRLPSLTNDYTMSPPSMVIIAVWRLFDQHSGT